MEPVQTAALVAGCCTVAGCGCAILDPESVSAACNPDGNESPRSPVHTASSRRPTLVSHAVDTVLTLLGCDKLNDDGDLTPRDDWDDTPPPTDEVRGRRYAHHRRALSPPPPPLSPKTQALYASTSDSTVYKGGPESPRLPPNPLYYEGDLGHGMPYPPSLHEKVQALRNPMGSTVSPDLWRTDPEFIKLARERGPWMYAEEYKRNIYMQMRQYTTATLNGEPLLLRPGEPLSAHFMRKMYIKKLFDQKAEYLRKLHQKEGMETQSTAVPSHGGSGFDLEPDRAF